VHLKLLSLHSPERPRTTRHVLCLSTKTQEYTPRSIHALLHSSRVFVLPSEAVQSTQLKLITSYSPPQSHSNGLRYVLIISSHVLPSLPSSWFSRSSYQAHTYSISLQLLISLNTSRQNQGTRNVSLFITNRFHCFTIKSTSVVLFLNILLLQIKNSSPWRGDLGLVCCFSPLPT
jgi:hypothetical protein